MYPKFLRFSGSCLMILLHIDMIHLVLSYKSKYILPVLPETLYTLNDIIILPENKDVVEATIISAPSSTVLATVELTLENGFRLDNAYTLTNESLESGMQITTSSKTTLVIELSTGLLTLPSVDEYGQCYYLFALENNLDTNGSIHLLIQSTVSETSIELCIYYSRLNETTTTDNLTLHSQGNPVIANCTTRKLPDFERLLFNNISEMQAIGITSEHPIIILEGHKSLSSSLFRNEGDSNTSESLAYASRISWRSVSPYSNWSNQFVLIPSEDRRELKLWIMSLVDTSVKIHTDVDIIRFDLTAKTPSDINISVDLGRTLVVTGKDKFSLNCIIPDKTSCRNDILPLNIIDMDFSHSYRRENMSEQFQWVYITNETKLVIICPLYINVTMFSSNGVIEISEEIRLNISNVFLDMKTFTLVSNGLYKISLNDTLAKCDIFELHAHSSGACKDEQCFNETNKSTKFSSIFSQMLNTSESRGTESINTVAPLNSTNILSESYTAEDGTVSVENMLQESTTAFVGSDKGNQNISALFMSSIEPVAMPSEQGTTSSLLYKLTKHDSDFHNKKFKAVVEILNSEDSSINKLNSKSDARNNPTYTYTFDNNAYYSVEGDGKSLIAIVVSLVSAILAVGAIILISLLKELFSRRQHIRNTRIRPFISDY